MTQKKELSNLYNLKKGDLYYREASKTNYYIIILEDFTGNAHKGEHIMIYGSSMISKIPTSRKLYLEYLPYFKKVSK